MLLDADRSLHPKVGEDTWELFEAIEESFGVTLGNFYVLAGISISDLAAMICELANYPSREKCLSAAAFFRLRVGLEVIAGAPSKSIRPSTSVRQLLPWNSRRRAWKKLEEHLQLRLPTLMFSGWLLLASSLFPLMLLGLWKAYLGIAISWISLIGLSAVFVLPTILFCLPLARSLPAHCQTVGDLARLVLVHNYARFAAHSTGSSDGDVLSALQFLVASETGIPPSEVHPRTRIPADLNIY